MSPVWSMWAFFGWFIGALVGGVYDTNGLDATNFSVLMQFALFREVDITLPVFGTVLEFPVPNTDYFRAVVEVLIWNSALWNGWAAYLRMGFLGALSFGFGLPLIIAFFTARIGR